MNPRKILRKVLAGSRNIRFSEIRALAEAYGFHLVRVSGSHHIYAHPEVDELLNFQRVDGQAKPYQVRQLMRVVERYDHRLGDAA